MHIACSVQGCAGYIVQGLGMCNAHCNHTSGVHYMQSSRVRNVQNAEFRGALCVGFRCALRAEFRGVQGLGVYTPPKKSLSRISLSYLARV